MKTVSHVTTVRFDRDSFAGITEAVVRQIVGQSGGRLVKASDDSVVDSSASFTPKEVKLLLDSKIELPETSDDVVTLLGTQPATILAAVVTGIKLAANQKMQGSVKIESPAARAERETTTRRTNAFIAWGAQNPIEAFQRLQESTRGPDKARAFDAFRDELAKSLSM